MILDATLTTLIKQIKADIQIKLGVPFAEQILTYENRKMKDEKTLEEYIGDNDAILIVHTDPLQ